ncbi:lamin tail domain-containing protein [Gleimia europaea]|uniref:LPXTG-domain-containing protein cell wall anchor domain n=1 Tax=Gleimia europaea ACS-120-V-Col10b TaxID=883069 RepID=A0A9W5VVS5_9ACTO|nr:lamin tail domain-containing protein [Gleimia europaea]EPD29490.1 LPXTG-domain-containing protein cell wall anchor domain [Gleimia europaea ACS-120-V-Col10b]
MVVINEIVYGDALVPGTNDSIELYNAGTETVDLTGWSLHDDKDRPGEADMSGSIAPGEFKVLVEGTDFTFGFGKGDTARLFNGEELVDSYTYEVNANENWSRCPDGTGEFVDVAITTKGQLNACGDPGFGLGGADSVRVFDGDMLVEEYSWTEHADHTYGRCPDMTGDFAQTREATPGERNACDGIPDLLQYYSTGEPPVVVDEAPTFLEDSSGLDYADGFLWAVDNGTGKFWKLVPQADGTVQFADGWEDGKRARFIKDAEGPDVVASAEWHITDLLPEVSANMGIEAIEWIPNAEAKGRLFDENTGEAYDPANYPNAVADGVFVVALEDNGHVYAFSLKEQGEVTPFVAGSNATLLTSYDSFIGGAMGLDYSRNTLRILSDDGYEGVIAEIFFDGTDSPRVVHYERPGGMPNLNNEGYAESDCIDGNRYAWFFADGFTSAALRAVPIAPESAGDCPTDPEEPGEPVDPEEPGQPGEPEVPGEPGTPFEPGEPTVPSAPGANPDVSETTAGNPGDLAKTGVETAGLVAIAGLLLAAGGVAVWSRRINS